MTLVPKTSASTISPQALVSLIYSKISTLSMFTYFIFYCLIILLTEQEFIKVNIFEEYKNLKSFEVEFHDQTYTHRIICKIRNILPDKMFIYPINEPEAIPEIGTQLNLNVFTENGIYNSISKVIDVLQENGTTLYAIAYPSQNKITQRREYFRANLNIPYKMSVKRTSKTDILEGETVNICGKGICISNTKPFLPYENIEVEISFPNHIINTHAEYVYSRAVSQNAKPEFYHAFVLTDIAQKDIDYIVGQCFLYQLS